MFSCNRLTYSGSLIYNKYENKIHALTTSKILLCHSVVKCPTRDRGRQILITLFLSFERLLFSVQPLLIYLFIVDSITFSLSFALSPYLLSLIMKRLRVQLTLLLSF